jgi:serine/threonine protein phosphatase PrpC
MSADVPCHASVLNCRSIGDDVASKVGCTAEPEVTHFSLTPKVDRFLVLASDGVWDALSNDKVCMSFTVSACMHLLICS